MDSKGNGSSNSNGKGSPARIWQWLKGQFVGEVPDAIELCEYDCRKNQCTLGEWETCDRRMDRAAGELMPPRDQSGPRV